MAKNTIDLDEEQVLAFRARRGHLLGPGAKDVTAAARAILGAQSQQLGPSLFALSQRTRKRPTFEQVGAALFEDGRPLVRTWGQRDTLHVYDAAHHWKTVVVARAQWSTSGRRGAMPPEDLVAETMAFLRKSGGPATRRDIQDIVSEEYLQQAVTKMGTEKGALAFAAGRLLWCLANRGEVCLAEKVGAEQQYVLREHWHHALPWEAVDATAANLDLVRQTLALHGPMRVQDVAHFWGAKISQAREWLAALRLETPLLEVQCEGRQDLFALAADRRTLSAPPPKTTGKAWPVRLLPQWDTLLMGHADKSWTVPQEQERPLVWGKSAVVAAVVLARGRVIATWTHKRKARQVDVRIRPLQGWRARYLAGVKQEAEALAAFYGVESVSLDVA